MNQATHIPNQKPAVATSRWPRTWPSNNLATTGQLSHDMDRIICSFIETNREMGPVSGDWLTDVRSREWRQGIATFLVMEQDGLIRHWRKLPVTFLHAGDEVDEVRTRVESDGGW